MLWKFRKPAITISAELHEKVRQSCPSIEEIQSEVIRVRPARNRERKITKVNSDQGFRYRV